MDPVRDQLQQALGETYRVDRELGGGGMSRVFLSTETALDRRVVLKILPPDLASGVSVDRFKREIALAARLQHAHIVPLLSAGEANGLPWFSMPYVEGESLRARLGRGELPVAEAVRTLRDVASALAYAHAKGIVHRDIKPENILLADGSAAVADFGVAKALEAAQTTPGSSLTSVGMALGTPAYMAPEQAVGDVHTDHRADLYALGVMAYEMLAGRHPFAGRSPQATMAAHMTETPAPVEQIRQSTPPLLAQLVTRCLAKNAADRPQTAQEIVHALDALVTPTGTNPLAAASGVVTSARDSATAAVSSRPRTGPLAAVAIAVLLIAAATTAWMSRAPAAPAAPAASALGRPLLAVRPFRSLSDDAQQAYFAAGMTEEIRGQLSQLSSLRILSRNGLDGYQDDAARAARELGVRHFVDGSVRVEGSRVRVSAELVDGSTQQTMWSQQYDRDLADILAVQGDVALQIARALQATLSPDELTRLERQPTQNADAYALYLESQQMQATDRAQNVAAQEMLRRALVMDPDFALARARLAYRLIFMGYYDSLSYVDRGMAEAQQAARTDPGLPSVHFALATGYTLKGMDAEARQAFLRALELDPNSTFAMNNFSVHDAQFGRAEEALYWARRGFALSGKQGNDYWHLGLPLLYLEADDELRALLLHGERRFPEEARVQFLLSVLDALHGRREDALARAAAVSERLSTNTEVKLHHADIAFLTDAPDLEARLEPLMLQSAENAYVVPESMRMRYAYALGKRGDVRAAGLAAQAERIALAKIDAGNQAPGLRVELAAAAVLRKDADEALTWVERAFDAGFLRYALLERDPILAPLREDPRFTDLLSRMRREGEAQRARAARRGLLDVTSLFDDERAAGTRR
jgi:TolB-like protein